MAGADAAGRYSYDALLLPLRSISLTHLRGANSVNNNMTSLLSFSSISVNRNYCIVGASFGKMAAAAATRTVHHASPMPMPMSAKRYCSQYALRINNNINKNKNPAPHWNNFGRSPSCQQRRWNGGNSSSSSSKRDADANSHPPTPTSMAESSPNNSTSSSSSSTRTTFLQRFLAPKAMPPRNTPRWYAEMALICTVFGITGTSTMFLVRPAVSDVLGLKGSFKEGPWSYRICSLVIMTPIYSTLLVIIGTIFGRHAYFRHFSVKMFSRFGVPPELMDKNYHVNAKNFKKW